MRTIQGQKDRSSSVSHGQDAVIARLPASGVKIQSAYSLHVCYNPYISTLVQFTTGT